MNSYKVYALYICALFSSLLPIALSTSYATTFALNDVHRVAPFRLCITENLSNTTSTCVTQNLSLAHYQQLSTFEKDAFVAVSMWQSYFQSNHSVWVAITVNNQRQRSGGSPRPGDQIWQSVETPSQVALPVKVIYPAALSQMQTGQYTAGPNMLVTINQENIQRYCLDQTPTKANRHCSSGRGRDVTTILLHEMGHGYGILSERVRTAFTDNSYGNFSESTISAFDYQTNNGQGYHDLLQGYATYFINHPIVFTGKSTTAYAQIRGQPQLLNICNYAQGARNFSQNFSHLCYSTCSPEQKNVVQPDLMGMWCNWNIRQQPRINITSLDLHILFDVGYADVLRTTTEIANLRAILFNPADDQ